MVWLGSPGLLNIGKCELYVCVCVCVIGASEVSETLCSGVQLRIWDICLYMCGDIRMSFVL